MNCAQCSTPISLAGGLWIGLDTRFACGEGRHAPAVAPEPSTPSWRNGVSVHEQLAVKHQANLQIIAERAERTQAVRNALGLGPFVPLNGPQTITGCSVAWIDAEGHHEASDCTVTVYGAAATVTTPDGIRFYDRLGSPAFQIRRTIA
jgi:hypothetical protein